MHQRHVSLLDEPGQPSRIGEHGHGILARHGQCDDFAAGLRQGRCHPAPFGGNEGGGAGARERLGDLDGRLLAAPGLEPGNGLQDGYLSHDPRFLGWALTNRNSWKSARAGNAAISPIAWPMPQASGPALLWLPGFLSDMASTKALALAEWAQRRDLPMLRFDYSAHGRSSGDFLQASIGDWLEEASAMLDLIAAKRRVIVVGSSMGGWIALLLARKLRRRMRSSGWPGSC